MDVNVLVALAWPSHLHHRRVQGWFTKAKDAGFRTCPMTQTGFVRLSSNPSFTRNAVAPRAALTLLDQVTSMAEHEFWPDDLPVSEAIGREQVIVGHRQIMDAYLVALARSRGGVVATLDRGMLAVAMGREGLVELVQGG